METIYQPNRTRITRDALVVAALLLFSLWFGGSGALGKFLTVATALVVLVVPLYILVVGYLPFLKISKGEKMFYRSDYGRTHIVDIKKITRIAKGSGVGGYRHALFVSYKSAQGKHKTLKVKSSIFNPKDITDLVQYVKGKKTIETNEELESFIQANS